MVLNDDLDSISLRTNRNTSENGGHLTDSIGDRHRREWPDSIYRLLAPNLSLTFTGPIILQPDTCTIENQRCGTKGRIKSIRSLARDPVTESDRRKRSANYISENVQLGAGWGPVEYDEYQAPFQWIGQNATISIQARSACSTLYIFAGSPDFSGTRNISITDSSTSQSQRIVPGWNGYQFELSPDSAASDVAVEITISIDRMLDIREDSRELGMMIREIHCVDHPISSLEREEINRSRNLNRRIAYYSSSQAPDILWLASFPRSGNTWVRFLLTSLLFEPVRESRTISRYIDEAIDPFSSERQTERRKLSLFGSKPAHILKTHMPFSVSMPLRENTIGAIYILRNPLDVAVSLCKFRSSQSEESLDRFLTYGVDDNMHLLDYTSWHSHVFSWLEAPQSFHPVPVMLVKYEDLVVDPYAACVKILNWLQIDRSSDHIHRAIGLSSIENLRKIESIEIANQEPGIFFTLEQKSAIEAGWRFLADGKSDNYHDYLTQSQIQKGLATFGTVMKRFSYM